MINDQIEHEMINLLASAFADDVFIFVFLLH